jgi:glycine/D-amino acid oxidase-like deaminating enzyme
MPDVVVVGGGIIGAACALALVDEGASVTLIERDELAAGASGRNQGWLVAPDDAANLPLYEPSLSRYRDAAGRAPLPIWIDADPVGHLLVGFAGDPAPADAVAMRSLDHDQLLALEPALSPAVQRGWLDDGGLRLDPAALTVGLALLAADAGATIRHHLTVRALDAAGDRVRGVVTDDGRIAADEVVLAAGPWSAALLDPLGIRLPIRPARGWIVRVEPPGPLVRHLVERVGWRESDWRAGAASAPSGRVFADEGVTAVGGALLNPHPDGSIMIGSSREPAIGPEPADPTVPRHQVADAIDLVPALAEAEVRASWWGVRPLSPDDRPLIGRVRDGLIVATGHGSEGVILGGGTAELVAAIVGGADPPFDPEAFDPFRFERPR